VRSRGYQPARYGGLEQTIWFFDNWYLRTMEPALGGDGGAALDAAGVGQGQESPRPVARKGGGR
jgi:hypothetical protein